MSSMKRVYCLHDGHLQQGYHNITHFVNKQGVVCKHTDDYCWWQNLGLFPTRAKALAYAKANHMRLDVHSISVHPDWYDSCLKDMVGGVK